MDGLVFFYFLTNIAPLVLFALVGVFFYQRYHQKKYSTSKEEAAANQRQAHYNLLGTGLIILSILLIAPIIGMLHDQLGQPFEDHVLALIGAGAVGVASGFAAYFMRVSATIPIMVISALAWWLILADVWLDNNTDLATTGNMLALVLLGLLLYQLFHLHTKLRMFKAFAPWYWFASFPPLIVFLFILSTNVGMEMLEEITEGTLFAGHVGFMTSAFLLLMAVIGVTTINVLRKTIELSLALSTSVLAVLFLLIGLTTNLRLVEGGELVAAGVGLASLINILLFALIVGFIFLGYQTTSSWRISLGTLMMFVFIFVKYIDWFFGFLDKSLFFIGAGILLFGLGYAMERGRRQLISQMK